MPNSISLFKKYTDLLDEVYKVASCTSDLDSDPALARAGANANEIIISKISMDGLANYSRNSGYVRGDVSLTHETVQYNYDRGRKFSVDNMDNEESAGLAFGKLSSEFIRTKTAPELDAFRFATYAGASDISVSSANLTSGEDVLAALVSAKNKMDEDEVDPNSRYLYITPTLYNLAKNVDTYKSQKVFEDFAGVKKVPQSRFYTAIDLYDGISEEEKAGGFKKASDGKDINFMIIEKSSVIQYPKHTVNKIITPEENQSDDSWMFFFRAYGLSDIYENKAAGIYLHHKL